MGNNTKLIKTGGASLAIVAGSMLTVTGASAHFGGGSDEDRQAQITELAERFNLDESEVKSYFEERNSEHKADRKKQRVDHLASLVEDGTLTQEQSDMLAEMQKSAREEIKTLRDTDASRDEVKALMDTRRNELKAWAEEQDIDFKTLRPERGGPGGDESHSKRDHESDNSEEISEESDRQFNS